MIAIHERDAGFRGIADSRHSSGGGRAGRYLTSYLYPTRLSAQTAAEQLIGDMGYELANWKFASRWES